MPITDTETATIVCDGCGAEQLVWAEQLMAMKPDPWGIYVAGLMHLAIHPEMPEGTHMHVRCEQCRTAHRGKSDCHLDTP